MSELVEITGAYLYERQRWGDTALIECEPPPQEGGSQLDIFQGDAAVTVKLDAGEDELKRGMSYRFVGQWRQHPKYGRQFHASTFAPTTPHGKTGTLQYLMHAPGIGLGIAEQLWRAFGGQAVKMLRENPDAAANACASLTPAKAAEAAKFLAGEVALENCTIALTDLLAGRGFPRQTARKAIREWGALAADRIRRNPYKLMAFRGCGFVRTDQMWLDLEKDPAALMRQGLCAWHGLAKDSEGHTWQTIEAIVRHLRAQISGAVVTPERAVRFARRAGIVELRRDEAGAVWAAEGKRARAERLLAVTAGEMLDGEPEWPDVAKLGLTPHQAEEASKALSSRLAVFCGSPGTGKTYSAARIVAAIMDAYGSEKVAVAAPTGKAAVRITEAMQAAGVNVRARTVHSLLGVASRTEGEGWGFEHHAGKPLDCKALVLDECSMFDTGLLASVLSAMPAGGHILMVGDTNQLPPVGHGRPLFDLIGSGMPCGRLTEIHRNGGSITRVCAAIRDAQPWTFDAELDDEGHNLALLPAGSAEAAAESMVRRLAEYRAAGSDPVWDCQIIVAVNAKSALSRKELNKRLQNELNPDGATAKGSPFRAGDKVVCLKNGFVPLVDGEPGDDEAQHDTEGKVFVANGEIGRVLAVEERLTIVRLDSPRRMLKIPRGERGQANEASDEEETSDTGCQWDLAYAISCHKSQGSEWPVVLVALDPYPGAARICSREWLYTAISRAKRHCLLVGQSGTAQAMCKRTAITRRKTFLKEQIWEQRWGV